MHENKISLYVCLFLAAMLLMTGLIWFSTIEVAIVALCLCIYTFFNLRAGRIPLKDWKINLFWAFLVSCVFIGMCYWDFHSFYIALIFLIFIQRFAPLLGNFLGWNEAPTISVDKYWMDDDGEFYHWTIHTNKNGYFGTLCFCVICIIIWLSFC